MATCNFCRQEFETSQAVRAHLKGCAAYLNRLPRLLTGLARCDGCGGPMMIRTGKPAFLREAQRHRKSLASGNAHRSVTLRKQFKETEVQIDRLHTGVVEGTVMDSAMLRNKLASLDLRREECVQLLRQLDCEAPPFRRVVSNEQAAAVASALKRRLIEAPAVLQRRYVRGLVSGIVVDHEKVIISGLKQALAAAVSSSALSDAVRSSAREWRALGESNPSCKIENLES